MAGFLAQYAPWPLRLSYLVFIVLLIPVALVIWKTQETVHKARSLGEASIAPRLAVPRGNFRSVPAGSSRCVRDVRSVGILYCARADTPRKGLAK